MPPADRVYFLADMHVKPVDAPNAAAREMAVRDNERLSAFLASIEGRASALVLLGDTFNFWFERRGKIVGNYYPTLELFHAAARRGLDIHHVSGNRDFIVGEGLVFDATQRYPGFFRFKRGFTVSRLCDFGIEPHGVRYRFHHAGKTVCCMHGDSLCARDYKFMMLRRLLQGWLGRTSMAYAPWFMVKTVFSGQQGRTGIRGQGARPASFFDPKTVWREFAMGADLLMCGHIHTHHERDVDVAGKQCRMVAMPAWLDGWYGYLEGGVLHIEEFAEGES